LKAILGDYPLKEASRDNLKERVLDRQARVAGQLRRGDAGVVGARL